MASYEFTYSNNNSLISIRRNSETNTFSFNSLEASTNGFAIFIKNGVNVLYIIDLLRDSIIGFSNQSADNIVYQLNNIFNLVSVAQTKQVFYARNNADQAGIISNTLIAFAVTSSMSGSITFDSGTNKFLLPEGYIYRAEFTGICNFSANGGKLLLEYVTDVDGMITEQNINRMLPPTAPISPSETASAYGFIDCRTTQKYLWLRANSVTSLNYLYGSGVTTYATIIINSI